MKIIETIAGILAEQVNSQIVDKTHFCTPPQANVEVGKLKNNELWSILLTPKDEQIYLDGGVYRTVGDYEIYFLTDQRRLDFDATDNLTQQEKCMKVAKDLLYRLHHTKGVKIVSENIESRLIYGEHDRACTGVSVKVRVEDRPQCLGEVDDIVSVEARLYNATTSSFVVGLSYEVGARAFKSKGFYWGLNAEQQDNEVVMEGDEYTLSDLEGDATYFVKPFVVTDKGVTYGEVVSVKLEKEVQVYQFINANEAIINGIVIPDEGEYGLCYATHHEPTTDDNMLDIVLTNYHFTKNVDGLSDDVLYFRSYLTINGVTTYSNEVSVDGKPYTQLEYIQGTGTQWMRTIMNKSQSYILHDLNYYFSIKDITFNGARGGLGGFWTGSRWLGVVVVGKTSTTDRYQISKGPDSSGRGYINYDITPYWTGTIRVEGADIYVNDDYLATLTDTSGTISNEYHIFRMASSSGGGHTGISSFKLCSCYVKYQNVYVFNLVPCKLKKDIPASLALDNNTHLEGEIGCWDVANNLFYSNNGSGVFGPGPEINQ